MTKSSKAFRTAKAAIDKNKVYTTSEAVELLKSISHTKFDATVDVAIKTNANPKYNDQAIRATVSLPHGTGKTVKVAAFVADDKLADAKKAGADIAGNVDLLSDLQAGNIEFDVLVTSPDMMRELAPVAKVLGPKGLMPSPKAGTVSPNIADAITAIKKGQIEFRLDKTGNIHGIAGKLSFNDDQLIENIESFLQTIVSHKPSGVKGKLIKKVVISSSMSPGIQIEAPNT
jgi:large subunit ribosomal protein L1